jgi:sucrose-6F-phosphate phosphohydrolase
MQPTWILASDIDNTLTGDREALDELRTAVAAQRARGEMQLFLSTGRRLDQVIPGFAAEGLPQGDAVISQVGTEIYLPPFTESTDPLEAWDQRLKAEFSREEALSFLQDIEGLEMQPEKYNTALKVSCYLDDAPDPDAAARQIKQRVLDSGKGDAYQVVWSSGRDLDIIPGRAGKGKAIQFLLDYLELAPEQVIVAGDSGNDRSMFDAYAYGVVVGNAKPELKQLQEELGSDTAVYFAERSYAAGVLEGLRHYGRID